VSIFIAEDEAAVIHSVPTGSPCETLAAASTPGDIRFDTDRGEHHRPTFMTTYAMGQWHPPHSTLSPLMREGSRRDFVASHDPAMIAVESLPSMAAVSLAYRALVSSLAATQ